MKNFKKAFRGFTLVEVLIVIIIIGILIAALLPRLTGSQARARDTARSAMVNQIANGVSLLLNDVGTISSAVGNYCMSGATGLISLTGSSNGTTVNLGTYMASVPVDPQGSYVTTGGGVGCTGAALLYNGGNFAYVYAKYEGSNGTNVAPYASTDTSVTLLQSLMSNQSDTNGGFGVLVR